MPIPNRIPSHQPTRPPTEIQSAPEVNQSSRLLTSDWIWKTCQGRFDFNSGPMKLNARVYCFGRAVALTHCQRRRMLAADTRVHPSVLESVIAYFPREAEITHIAVILMFLCPSEKACAWSSGVGGGLGVGGWWDCHFSFKCIVVSCTYCAGNIMMNIGLYEQKQRPCNLA